MWTGNFLKDRRLRPIIAWTKKFPSKKDKSIVFAEKKKQYLIMQSLSISLKEVLWIICKVIYRQENC